MSKLNLTFTDESGTNLNQYKMTRNVGSASETTEIIKLERNANITTQGTTIDAEKLNAMVNAINEPISALFQTFYEETTTQIALPKDTSVDFLASTLNKINCFIVFTFYFLNTLNERKYATITVGKKSSFLGEHVEIVQLYDSVNKTTQNVKIVLSSNQISITNLTNENTTDNVLYIESIIGA